MTDKLIDQISYNNVIPLTPIVGLFIFKCFRLAIDCGYIFIAIKYEHWGKDGGGWKYCCYCRVTEDV